MMMMIIHSLIQHVGASVCLRRKKHKKKHGRGQATAVLFLFGLPPRVWGLLAYPFWGVVLKGFTPTGVGKQWQLYQTSNQ